MNPAENCLAEDRRSSTIIEAKMAGLRSCTNRRVPAGIIPAKPMQWSNGKEDQNCESGGLEQAFGMPPGGFVAEQRAGMQIITRGDYRK